MVFTKLTLLVRVSMTKNEGAVKTIWYNEEFVKTMFVITRVHSILLLDIENTNTCIKIVWSYLSPWEKRDPNLDLNKDALFSWE